MKKLVIVLPTFNEKKNIEKFLKEIFDQEKNTNGWRFEILIANDIRSNDRTDEFVKKLAQKNSKIHIITVSPGLGTALIEGHRYAIAHLHPTALAQLDADGQVGAEVLVGMTKALDTGFNFVIGSRFVKGGKNMLSFSRRFYSAASSVVSRILMGPLDVKEWSNSARAFTPELFEKIDLNLVPWQERTFIVQPSFLHAAIEAGAKYTEIPLIFKDRAEGYSKMKVFNYSYDVLAYALDVRMRKMGIPLPIFKISRRSKTFLKFGLVGFMGTMVDFFFYKLFIVSAHLTPAISKGFSTEAGIINNFIFNNYWTFKHRKTSTNVWQRFIIYNIVSLGGLAIAVLVVKFLHDLYGDGSANILGTKIAYNNFYFFATVPPVMIWNFTINHFVTWRNKKS
jgi:dolichol-phosphate mannosyltransferase